MKSDKRVNADELPLVLTPMDIAAVLGISRNTAYELLHSTSFPAFRVGKQFRVTRERFLIWLDSKTGPKEAI